MVVLLDLAVLATVVLVAVVVVLVVAAAGFSAGFAVGPVVGSSAAGLAWAGDLSALSPDTSRLSVFPAGGVAASGSTGGVHHAASTKGPASGHHKPRRHKRPTQTSNAAIGTGRIKPRGVDGKPTAGPDISKA